MAIHLWKTRSEFGKFVICVGLSPSGIDADTAFQEMVSRGFRGEIVFEDGTGEVFLMERPIVSDTWCHVALTNSAIAHAFFIDGKLVDSKPHKLTPVQSSMPVVIGGNGYSDLVQTWQGDVDNFRLYDRALTGEEIKTIYDIESKSVDPSGQLRPNQDGEAASPANQKSPLFTEADRDALLSVGCPLKDANGDSNHINVHHVTLTPAVADAIGHMDQLRVLGLAKSTLNNEQLARIGHRPSVEQLWLWDAKFDAQGFVTICSNFPNLKLIELIGVKPPSVDTFRNIQKLDKLTSLDVGWCGINHDDLKVIVQLPKLETLRLLGTKIVDRELRVLSECKTLKTLIVSKDNFKVSKTALKVFNQAVPDCKLDIRLPGDHHY
ncbi:MAG: LamG domain-containing protein [Planctomycetaceae bacterium]